MSVLSSIGRLANNYAEARARHRTERMLLSLPADLRKDIGFPEAFETRRRRVTFTKDIV